MSETSIDLRKFAFHATTVFIFVNYQENYLHAGGAVDHLTNKHIFTVSI